VRTIAPVADTIRLPSARISVEREIYEGTEAKSITRKAMTVKIKCTRPKYASGELEFSRFEDVWSWLCGIKRLSKGAVGRWLYSLAKTGFISMYSTRYSFEINSGFHDYFLARELGFKVGLLKTRRFGDSFSRERAVALDFAKELDKHISKLHQP